MNQSFKKVSKGNFLIQLEVNSYYPEEFISEEKISQSIL